LKDLPRRRVSEIEPGEAERLLDAGPLILEGATICPGNVTLKTLEAHCSAAHRVQYSVFGGHDWAGLREVDDSTESVTIAQFVQQMEARASAASQKRDPRYLFSVSPFDVCPGLMDAVRLPAEMSSAFVGQWAYRGTCHLPLYRLFLSEQGFRTNLHVDAGHATFVASMCQGRKRWRVLSSSEYTDHRKVLGRSRTQPGVKFNNALMFADLPRPFQTWGPKSRLENANVSVFEGILEPGEILIIPKGAPHAAEALDDSFMVAMNDLTFKGAEDIHDACKKAKTCPSEGLGGTSKEAVRHFLSIRQRALKEYQGTRLVKSLGWEEKPFLQAYGCAAGKYCEMLRRRSAALNLGIKYSCGHDPGGIRSEL